MSQLSSNQRLIPFNKTILMSNHLIHIGNLLQIQGAIKLKVF